MAILIHLKQLLFYRTEKNFQGKVKRPYKTCFDPVLSRFAEVLITSDVWHIITALVPQIVKNFILECLLMERLHVLRNRPVN